MRQYIPINLPASIRIPFVGVITGDGVVFVFVVGVVLAVLLIVIVAAMVRGATSRSRMADQVLSEATNTRGVTTGSASSVHTTLEGMPTRNRSEMGGGSSYRVTMEQIGGHLATADAQQVAVGEVEGGYLLLYTHKGGELMVETLTPEQVAAFPHAGKGLGRPLQQRFAQMGRLLDQQFAISVMISQQQGGFYVEYAAPPSGPQSAAKLVRVSRLLDDEAFARLSVAR